MKALLMLACVLGGCARPSACYRAESNGRGWRRVSLPRAAPWLAAPADVDQFRSDETAVAWSDWRRGERAHGVGASRFHRALPPEAELVELEFAARLAGAGVEVIGERGLDSYTIQPRTRVQGDRVLVEVEPGTNTIVVVVHHHLRKSPLMSWRVGRRARIDELTASPEFRRPASLYYFDAGTGVVELCDAPARLMGVRASRVDGDPRDLAIAPTLLTRLFHR